MAKMVGRKAERKNAQPHRRTSIGKSANTRPKSKSDKRSFKRYRGQG